MMEDNEEEQNDDNYMCPEYSGNARGEAEDEEVPDEPIIDDDLRRVIVDAQTEAESALEKLKLEQMLEDHKKSCTQLAKMGTQSSVPHWNYCNGRQRMVYLTRDLGIY
jgi:hypothetical protein